MACEVIQLVDNEREKRERERGRRGGVVNEVRLTGDGNKTCGRREKKNDGRLQRVGLLLLFLLFLL